MHASAYYGLARIALLEKDLDAAERLFQKSLESEPEAFDKAWVLVYLGRLSVAAGERDRADGVFPKRSSVGRRDRKGAPGSEAGPGTDQETVRKPEGVFTHETNDSHRHPGNRRRCHVPDGPGPRPARRDSQGTGAEIARAKLEALQALQAAGNDPDKSIAAAEELITKFADTDFKAIALYIEADAYQRKGDCDHMVDLRRARAGSQSEGFPARR